MYPQFPLRPSPPRAAISTPNFREDGRCCATRPRRGETSGVSVSVSVLVHGLSLSLSLSLARGVVVMAVVVFFVSICFLGMPSNSLPHTRAVNEKPTSMGQDIHKRSLSEALLKVLAAQERSFFSRCCRCDDDDDDDDIVHYDYFHKEMAARLVDRLDDIKRAEGFPLALDIGAGSGHIYRVICSDDAFEGEGGIGGVRKMVLLDSSAGMLGVDDDDSDGIDNIEGSHRCDAYKLHADEEDKLPFPDGTFDLVTSSQAIHWVNDLPKLFQEVNRVLKPDGCFMFSMIGGATLPELRIAMTLAELEREGGVGAHVGPFVELSDVGSLMQNAGFSLPTIDVDTVKISYPSAPVLMEHLQRMGEGNASLRRREHTGRDIFLAASCIYDEMYPVETEGEEHRDVEATAQVIFAIGWTPHASQQNPEPRGSATHRIGDMVTDHKGEK
mmetsp:Transcript_17072/g.35237  ORF Transcript_17072/g.35237 Transcript_17072/m.35237 type:complete len:442 (-) Transcript_17072:84-1409(-)